MRKLKKEQELAKKRAQEALRKTQELKATRDRRLN
jgi:hypothetical protein